MNALLRKEALDRGLPLVNYLMQGMAQEKKKTGMSRTLLAVCPNSLSLIRSALRAAKRWDAPLKFAATLNQVDIDGGYTGLTPIDLVRFIRSEAARIHLQVPIMVAIDHGGPWLKDQHTQENWPYAKTMEHVKKSFEVAIAAGYDLIHVDPTVDRTLPRGAVIPIEWVVERTAELIKHAENFRRQGNYPPIAYEVGTEEVHGGLANMDVFRKFLTLLKSKLIQEGLGEVWPVFVVGKVGTDLHTSTFNPMVAQALVLEAAQFDTYIKGHYTDNVDHPEDYPLAGMGAANVGPEFTESEYDALAELQLIQDELYDKGALPLKIPLLQLLRSQVVASGRWKKWLLDEENSSDFSALQPERQQWLIKTGCRYIWENPNIVAARSRLFESLRIAGIDPDAILDAFLQKTLDKYFEAFHLKNLNTLLTQQIAIHAQAV